ncbi:hypothetical protein B9T36_11070 [Acinetobacter sp. ANC 4204]|uniref:hypothetical protein n=1 Tax=Acinetobacter sp. ANC 4204 TaxID=1977884 RepID=UPI000A34D723|nr:hypothetical protein [Acinetobacter sp. ANC 4204]OTG58871.1 hypothetical protein B9T36_11070 [Acinetobacter sp. ANC 4204]
MKIKLLFSSSFLLAIYSTIAFASDVEDIKPILSNNIHQRTLDERCDGHASYVMKLLKNRYNGESIAEQIELADEWSDPVYRDEIKRILSGFIYTLPIEHLESEIKYQALHTYIAAYRNCITRYS